MLSNKSLAVKHSLLFAVLTLALAFIIPLNNANADGDPDAVEQPVKRAPAPQAPVVEQKVEAAPVAAPDDNWCEWMFRLSPGVTTWFFDEESTLPGASLSFDMWRTDYPINYRVGVEGRHMKLGQEAAEFAMEFVDKTTEITFIRIPFAIEYMHAVGDSTTWYIGGGPDIIHTANDISETSVGMHLGTRLHYAFNDSWGVSVEAGYMWGEVDGEGSDVVLDNAYITPAVAYTF